MLVVSIPGAVVLWIVGAATSTSITDPFTGGTHRYVPAPFNYASAVVLAAEIILLRNPGRTEPDRGQAGARDRSSSPGPRWLIGFAGAGKQDVVGANIN